MAVSRNYPVVVSRKYPAAVASACPVVFVRWASSRGATGVRLHRAGTDISMLVPWEKSLVRTVPEPTSPCPRG